MPDSTHVMGALDIMGAETLNGMKVVTGYVNNVATSPGLQTTRISGLGDSASYYWRVSGGPGSFGVAAQHGPYIVDIQASYDGPPYPTQDQLVVPMRKVLSQL